MAEIAQRWRPTVGRPQTVREFLDALSRRRVSFTVATGSVLIILLAWLLLTPARYVSHTQLLVSISGSTTAAAYQNDDVARERVNSYIALMTSDVVGQRVVDTLGLPQGAAELAKQVSAIRVPPNTSIIDVAVKADSPERAQALAGAYAREFVAYATALETPTGKDEQKVRVTTVSTASDPRSNTPVRIALGALAALTAALLGAVTVWIRAPRRGSPDGVPADAPDTQANISGPATLEPDLGGG